ncbi:ParM/StbA family protein [Geoalkalibacter halelectricus]|uniref:ParM/StbA family protein n=1 Tax=Geoalkalibacter halelectricus TaxID=2847045 RepID=A0ABY5ZTH9_9BACT|nr:ParM/StbA family protein [Geoalkalibacter halelectricus]MDO3376786.1 ParM/StbA family protein [Geoalkalibacter halelectricus]UWZ81262.1 ParM/StbA family protein [Geoalkalibacter halelectricus]
MEILGVDIGFGFTKATNGRDALIFKSVLGEATELQFQEQILQNPQGSEDHLRIEVDGKGYFVGELAERQSSNRFFTLDPTQLVGRFARILALTAASRLVGSYLPINLVTGLPIGYYRQHKEALNRVLAGEHKILVQEAGGKKVEKTLSVNKVRIIPQPFGSLFNAMLNDSGELSDKRLVKEKIGIVDVGFRTSDYTISDRMRYSERGSRTTDSGIAKAFTAIANALREQSGVNIELYRLYDAVEKGTIKVRGKEFDLRDTVEQAFNQLATAVAAEVERLWADDWDVDAIVVTGGGGAVLAPYLLPLIEGNVLPVEAGRDARLNNVTGYWKFGRHLWAKGELGAGS